MIACSELFACSGKLFAETFLPDIAKMKSRDLMKILLYTGAAGALFLIFVGVASGNLKCPSGHHWSMTTDKGSEQPYWFCARSACLKKAKWYDKCPLGKRLPKISPRKIVEVINHWALVHSVEEAHDDTGVAEGTISDICHVCQDAAAAYMDKVQKGEKIGGSNRIVCIDETQIKKRKKVAGHEFGSVTLGNKTTVIAGVELDGPWAGRKTTGRCFMVV